MKYSDSTTAVLTGASLGAAMMFLLDPNRGRRRRALVRDKLIRSANVTTDALQGVSRDLGHRASGAVASWRSQADEPVDDQVLVERVRAQMGHVVSQPGQIEVRAQNGCVVLAGEIPVHELRGLLRAVKRVHGVREVTNVLTVRGNGGILGGMGAGWPMVALAAAGAAVAARALRANGRRHLRRSSNGQLVAADIMTSDPACCSPGTTLDEVAKLMRHADCGEIPILNTDGRPIGVVTDRDIVTRIVAEGMNPVAHTAEQCMTHKPVTVRAETPLQAVIDTMERHQIRRVPVVDASGACIGIVSQADIAREAHEHSVGELVREVSESPAS